MKVSKFVVSSR